MKNVWYVNLLILAAFVGLGLTLPSLSVAAEKVVKIDGEIDIEFPNAAEAKVEVNLTGDLLGIATKSIVEKNPGTSGFLAGLQVVKVRIYEVATLGGKSFDDVLKFYKKQLPESKWKVLARVNDKESNVSVYTSVKGDYISGLVVLVGNSKEVIAVNLAGKIDLNKLPNLSGMSGLGDIANIATNIGSPQPSFVVMGVVKDAKTGKPIAGAKVSDGEYGQEPRKSTTTDSDGKYKYSTWYEEHFIVAEAHGYKVQRQLLTTKFLRKEDEKAINFELEPEN